MVGDGGLARGRGRPRQVGSGRQREKEGEKEAGSRAGRWAGEEGSRLASSTVRGGKGRKGKGRLGLGRVEEKREENEKERVGRAQSQNEGVKELHSNAFEFQFEI
jgi:hypothetical protein